MIVVIPISAEALGICELDILQEILLTKQAKAEDVQIPFKRDATILEVVASWLPGTCVPRSWFIRVFEGPAAKLRYHQDSAHYLWRAIFRISSHRQDQLSPLQPSHS